MKAGDTFYYEDGAGGHRYVVISDPKNTQDIRFPGYVFFVMFSSKTNYKEDVCVLKEGDHPFIVRDTVVVYKIPPAIFEPMIAVQKLLNMGILKDKKQPVSPDILKKLRDCYTKSQYRKDSIMQFLFRQGVID